MVWSWEGLTRSGLDPSGGTYCVSRVAAANGVAPSALAAALVKIVAAGFIRVQYQVPILK